jgi:hypothetical protein
MPCNSAHLVDATAAHHFCKAQQCRLVELPHGGQLLWGWFHLLMQLQGQLQTAAVKEHPVLEAQQQLNDTLADDRPAEYYSL